MYKSLSVSSQNAHTCLTLVPLLNHCRKFLLIAKWTMTSRNQQRTLVEVKTVESLIYAYVFLFLGFVCAVIV